MHDDRTLFEFLVLEGAQAGLSWITILRKRDAYREAFAGFEPARVARFDRRKVAQLGGFARIVGDSEGFRRAALFDDEVSLVRLDDLLNLRQLVAGKHRETRRVCADSFIFIDGERDRFEAGGVTALADPVAHRHDPREVFVQGFDPLIHFAEQGLSFRCLHRR